MSTIRPHIPQSSSITLRNYFRLFRSPLQVGSVALIVVNLLDLVLPLIVRSFLDALQFGESVSVVGWCAVAYVVAAVMQCLCRFSWRVVLGRAGVEVATSARAKAVEHALTLPHQTSVGESVSAAHSDAELFARSFDAGIVITIDALMNVVAIPIVLFTLDPSLAWKVLLPLPCISLLILWLDSRVKEQHRVVQNQLTTMTRLGQELISQARAVKVHTAEKECIHRFEVESKKFRDVNRSLLVVESIFGPGMESFISLGLISLMVFGIPDTVSGVVTLGTFVAFHNYIQQLQWPMRAVALSLSTFRKSYVSGARLREYISHFCFEDQASRGDEIIPRGAPICAVQIGIPWEVRGPKRVAIIGPVGGGKTTLLKKIAGVIPTKNGEVCIGGTDINHISSRSLHSFVSMVPQESELFGVTIRENLAMGLPHGESITEQALHDSLSVAALLAEVQSLPEGLDTVIGERGMTLSGGQRQRLSLARALLRRPKILLLDNCLAAVDAETEAQILLRLAQLQIIVICVTQRLSTVQACDEVVTVVGGMIQGFESTERVMKSPAGWTKEFVLRQKGMLAVETLGNQMLERS